MVFCLLIGLETVAKILSTDFDRGLDIEGSLKDTSMLPLILRNIKVLKGQINN